MGAGSDGEPGLHGVDRGIGHDLRRIDVEFLAPHQPRRLALLHDGREETAERLQPIACADARQAGVIGQRLSQIIPDIPPCPQAVRDLPHQQALGPNILEEHHQLQLEKDYRIDARSPPSRVERRHQIAHERQIEGPLDLPIEMVGGDQLLQRQMVQRRELPLLCPHHAPEPLVSH